MKRSCRNLFLLPALLLPCAARTAPACPLPAPQDPILATATVKPPKDKRVRKEKPEKAPSPAKVIAAQAKELKSLLAAKGGKDTAAARVIKELADFTRQCPKKEHRKIAAILAKVFRIKRPPTATEIYAAATAGLAAMGPKAVKYLEKPLGDRAFRTHERRQLRADMIKALGSGADPDALKTLTAILVEKDRVILQATLQALEAYDKAPERTRREVATKVLDRYGETMVVPTARSGNKPAAGNAGNAGTRQLEQAFNSTLKALTGQDLQGPDAWRRWLTGKPGKGDKKKVKDKGERKGGDKGRSRKDRDR